MATVDLGMWRMPLVGECREPTQTRRADIMLALKEGAHSAAWVQDTLKMLGGAKDQPDADAKGDTMAHKLGRGTTITRYGR